jgi:hypothetical protein
MIVARGAINAKSEATHESLQVASWNLSVLKGDPTQGTASLQPETASVPYLDQEA